MAKYRVFLVFLIAIMLLTGCSSNKSPTANITQVAAGSYTGPASIIIAASNTPERKKAQADIICDGINDSKNIAGAISSLKNGGQVFLLAGTYNLNQRLLVNAVDNLTLYGEGTSTILKQNDAVMTALASAVQAGENKISVVETKGLVPGQDIYIGSTEGAKQTQDAALPPYWEAQRMVGPAGESNIITEIKGNTLTLFYNLTNSYKGTEYLWTMFDATYFNKCRNLKVMNLALDGNRDMQITTTGDIFLNGLRFSGCPDLEVTGVYVHDVYYNHIMQHPGACLRGNIHHNIVATTSVSGDSQTRGIVVEVASDGTIVAENHVIGHETGIYNVGSSATIVNNYCLDNKLNGILNNRGANSIISGNIIKGASTAGIAILNGKLASEPYSLAFNNIISNNLIISTRSGQAIDCYNASYNSIFNNTVTQSGRKGIRILGGTYNIISGNYITDAGQSANASFPGIELASAADGSPSRLNQVKNNIIAKSLTNDLNYCIYLDDKSVDNIITDNQLGGFATNAINQTGSRNTIERNIVLNQPK